MLLDDHSLAAALESVPPTWEPVDGLRGAAVLAGVQRREGRDCLVFTERRTDLPTHPGQISFPGGSREGEEDPAACALRETHEEIQVPPHSVTLLGTLSNRTSSSSFRVHTLVGRIDGAVCLRPDPGEVASVFAVPFAELLDEARWEDRVHELARGKRGPSPHFWFEGHLIWGLTGRLTRDLVAAVLRAGGG